MKLLLFIFVLTAALSVNAQSANTVDLLWSADTYTPPFYRGKALPSSQSQVTVIAQPTFGTVDKLTFNWVKDGRNIGSASGLGKNVLVYTAETVGRGNDIRVMVDGVSAQLFLPVMEPRVVVYEDDALRGASYHQSVSSYTLGKPEVSFLAEPYYFSRADVANKRLEFDWRLNGKKVITDVSDQRLATFAAPEEGSGENTLTIAAKNLANTLQTATARLVIKFNQQGFSF